MKNAGAFRRPDGQDSVPGRTELPQQRSCLADALHVFVLTSFAVSHPVYDRLGQRAAFLVDSGVSPSAVFIVMGLLSVALPGLLVLVERCAAFFGRRPYEATHGMVVFILLVLAALPACRRLDMFLSDASVLGFALVLSVAGIGSYFTSRRVRAVVTLSAPGIVLFPAMLLFGSSITGMLLRPQPLRIDRWSPVPVVMVVFDEFCGASLMTTDRKIDADRFPNFAELARQSTWFRNATSVYEDTEHALPAILSGRYPAKWPGAPLPIDLPQNLFSIVESTGDYEVAAFEPVSNLAGNQREAENGRRPDLQQQVVLTLDALSRIYIYHIVPPGYEWHLPRISPLWFGVRNSATVDRDGRRGAFRYAWDDDRGGQWRHFLRCLEPGNDATLYFMHLVIPHISWCYLPSGRRYTSDSDGTDLLNLHSHNELLVNWGNDELLVEQQHLRYLLQLQYVDRLIGELTARLRKTGLYEKCLLIVTADHGVSFRANQPRRHVSDANQADILSIPLFIKRPSQSTGAISDRAVESIDILPTITDVLGIRLRDPIDGRSVFDNALSERMETTFCQVDRRHERFERAAIDSKIVAQPDLPELTRLRFGDSPETAHLFRIGPMPELVGRKAEDLPKSSVRAFDIEPTRYGDVYEESPDAIVPCFFEGRIHSPHPEHSRQALAIAVNGTIRAVTRPYRLKGLQNRWAALVPESSFRPGKNDIQFFAVTGSGPDWRLAPCAVRGSGR